MGILAAVVCAVICCSKQPRGKPFIECGIQKIPGRVQCEFYDLGGEGVAYHDSDAGNSGSGKLNPADGTTLHDFRMREGADISFTKSGGVDDNGFNFVQPSLGSLYVGWTEPGEWVNYTVRVAESARYRVGLMLTSNRGGRIALSANGRDVTGPLSIQSTFVAADTVAWRQWHYWNFQDGLAEIVLKKGIHRLTLRTIAGGNMNYDYLDFTLVR